MNLRIFTILIACISFILLSSQSVAAESAALYNSDGKGPQDGGVAIRIWLADDNPQTILSVRLHALEEGGSHYHLYPPESKSGIPLNLRLKGLTANGSMTINAKTKRDAHQSLIYAQDTITAEFPVLLPREDASVTLTVSYLACGDNMQCKQAVMDHPIQFTVKGIGDRAQSVDEVAAAAEAKEQEQLAEQRAKEQKQLALQAHNATATATGIHWRHVETKLEVEALIADAHKQNKRVFLDFTGPSCINCQAMAKTILVLPQIRDGWNAGVAIEINTDASSELAQWQLDRFGTYTRPLYVRMDPDGGIEKWNKYFGPDDTALLADLESFLNGGQGNYTGSGEGWFQFIILALLGGLFTLVMPCTYPMIPLTINFFNKQATAGKKIVPLALAYSGGILLSFTLLGVVVGVILGKAITNISGDPWINFVIGIVFIVLGLSLIGVFFLRLPSGIAAKFSGSGQMGYVGALLMGLTFAITAFTCTAPFAGAVLAEGAQSGNIIRPTVGMMIYASVIAVPFFFLSISPRLMEKLPRAGSWMNEFKFVGGLVEIAAALKFLAISDFAWEWGIIGRDVTLSLWILLSLACLLYLAGVIRMSGDAAVGKPGVMRSIFCLIFLGLSIWLFMGLIGFQHLGIVESFFPGDAAPAISS